MHPISSNSPLQQSRRGSINARISVLTQCRSRHDSAVDESSQVIEARLGSGEYWSPRIAYSLYVHAEISHDVCSTLSLIYKVV